MNKSEATKLAGLLNLCGHSAHEEKIDGSLRYCVRCAYEVGWSNEKEVVILKDMSRLSLLLKLL